jgi:aryl-alcohol dehydrogenase-like predicted oxidoreductase
VKLGLGTVQFGLDYGISNNDGRTPVEEVCRILSYAASVGIQVLDTSPSYGVSERILGTVARDAGEFRVVTKARPHVSDSRELASDFQESLRNLCRSDVFGLLMHRSSDLLSAGGAALYAELLRLKGRGLVRKIGVSVYSAAEIDDLLERYSLDLIQVPVSVLDQRLVLSGHLKKMKDLGIEIHARSIFLQGLLLMSPESLKAPFEPLKECLLSYHQFIAARGLTPVAAALNFVQQIAEIDVAICGVNSLSQLEEIVGASKIPADMHDMRQFAIGKEMLLNPVLWATKRE